MAVERRTVDLSAYPDLVVMYLGMRVNALYGLKTIMGLKPGITGVAKAKPDGFLLHEDFLISLIPMHAGMRQYGRDWDSLERWARSEPHRLWWQNFLTDSGGTGFWHETYFVRGGIEAIYDDMTVPIGMMKFAPLKPARGRMFSARTRAARGGEVPAPVVTEQDLYGRDGA